MRAFGLQNTLHVLPSQREDRRARDRPVGCCEVRLHQPRRAVRQGLPGRGGAHRVGLHAGVRVVGRASVLGGGRQPRAEQRPAVPLAHRGAAQLAGPGGAARAGAQFRRARDGGADALHAGRARRPVEGAGGGKQPAPAPGVLRAGERRGGAGGGTVVPARGAGGPGPGVRGREEERAHEAAGVAGGDAASVGGRNEPGVRPRRRGGPGDGREPRRATGAGARGRRRGGGAATSAQPAVRAHRAGGEAPLGGEVGRAGAEARPVCRVRADVGCCPADPAGARAGRGGSRRGEAEDRDARREDRGAGGGAAAGRRGSPAPQGSRRAARSGKAPRRGDVESEGEGSRKPRSASCPGEWSCTSRTWPTSIRSGT